MRFIIHADDFGLSKGITDTILECFDNGVLSSTSIVPNGHAFDYAIEEYKKREDLRLSIHLNLIEGKPLLPAQEINLLVNEKGQFHYSFPALWFKYITSSPVTKLKLKTQVKKEIRAQIQKVLNALGHEFTINLDSHCHYHIMPFIFEAIMELKEEFNIAYIRLPSEPFFLSLTPMSSIKTYFSLNLLKHFIANHLTKNKKQLLVQKGIQTSDYFIGVLFVAGMSDKIVKSALLKIPDRNSLVEILFHPGSGLQGEEHLFKKEFVKNYYASWQTIERETLKSPQFKDFINNAR